MSRAARWGAAAVLLAAIASLAAADLIPTPNFSQHAIPTAQLPAARGPFREIADTALLLAALSAATYGALVSRSRNGLFALSIASLIWFGFWRKGCICSVGSIQNVALAIFQPDYVVPYSAVAFLVLPLIFTLFFGRTFCAAVCPLGAVQELVAVRTVQVPRWLDHALGLLKYVYLGAAVLLAATGTAFLICRYDPFVAFFRLNGNANIVLFGGALLLVGLFVGRPYCRYLCPYGALLAMVSRVSKWHVRIPPTECIHCRLCEDVCPYGAIQRPTVDPSPAEMAAGRRRLAWLLLATPAMIALTAAAGTMLADPLARLDPEVALAEQLRREELGLTAGTTDATDAFRNARRPADDLYRSAARRRSHFLWLGALLGDRKSVV